MQNELLATAEAAARAAGAEALRLFRQGVQPREKSFRESVTEGDLAAQRAALEVIRARHPDHAILAEEDDGAAPGPAGLRAIARGVAWIIDPVDGTNNYARGVPFFNVSISGAQDGQPVVGAIYDPLRDELFAGARGQGATLNGRAMHVSPVTGLADAVIAFDSPSNQEPRLRQWAALPEVAARCRTLRALGSAALGMAYVAAGRLDAYVHFDVHPWDVAAGALLTEVAGGAVRRPDGGPWQLGQPAVMMGSAAVLDALALLLAGREG